VGSDVWLVLTKQHVTAKGSGHEHEKDEDDGDDDAEGDFVVLDQTHLGSSSKLSSSMLDSVVRAAEEDSEEEKLQLLQQQQQSEESVVVMMMVDPTPVQVQSELARISDDDAARSGASNLFIEAIDQRMTTEVSLSSFVVEGKKGKRKRKNGKRH
jgi:hypothetical protein